MIRDAADSDLEQVFDLIGRAFGQEAEAALVRQLIRDGDVLVNLVFEYSGTLVGNVVVSRLSLAPDAGLRCGAVAPLSVIPEQQSAGIGSQLMRAAIARSRELQVDALFVLGDPRYYARFDFAVSGLASDYSAEYFQHLELSPGCLGNVRAKAVYADAFASL